MVILQMLMRVALVARHFRPVAPDLHLVVSRKFALAGLSAGHVHQIVECVSTQLIHWNSVQQLPSVDVHFLRQQDKTLRRREDLREYKPWPGKKAHEQGHTS